MALTGIQILKMLPKMLKEEIKDKLIERCKEEGMPEFYDMIATEEQGETEEEILKFLKKVGHPALEMEAAV